MEYASETSAPVPAHGAWPAAERIVAPRVVLEPLRRGHADEMARLLDDRRLHRYTGGSPLPLAELRARFALLERARSPDYAAGWLNWIVRRHESGAAVGTVQATLHAEGTHLWADIAWVVGTAHQGQGLATEAARAMTRWLERRGVAPVRAHINPEHRASVGVAQQLGMHRSGISIEGEEVWSVRSAAR